MQAVSYHYENKFIYNKFQFFIKIEIEWLYKTVLFFPVPIKNSKMISYKFTESDIATDKKYLAQLRFDGSISKKTMIKIFLINLTFTEFFITNLKKINKQQTDFDVYIGTVIEFNTKMNIKFAGFQFLFGEMFQFKSIGTLNYSNLVKLLFSKQVQTLRLLYSDDNALTDHNIYKNFYLSTSQYIYSSIYKMGIILFINIIYKVYLRGKFFKLRYNSDIEWASLVSLILGTPILYIGFFFSYTRATKIY